jgi:hypothetical protein
MIGISLGYNCNPAIIGVKLGLRNTKQNGYLTCPFDECVTTYHGIILCLEENFKYFLDLNYIKLIESKEDFGGCKKGDKLICNTRYNFIFNHESPGHANLYLTQNWDEGINHYTNNNYEKFIKRYSNRINNFKNYLSSGYKINFLITRYIKDTIKLNYILTKLYPNLDFEITFFDTNESKNSIIKHYQFSQMENSKIIKEFEINKIENNKIYIIVSRKDNNYHTGFCALGHEIHLSRYLLLDIFNRNYIDKDNVIIVTVNIDRKFLYSKIFDNIISYDEFIKLNIESNNILNLCPFMTSSYIEIKKYYIDLFKLKSEYPIESILYINMKKNFEDLLKKINYQVDTYNSILLKNNYIIIHHRSINTQINNNNPNINYDITQQIIKFILKNFDYDIIIFSSDINIKFNNESNKLYYINSLELYCSIMTNERCIAVISELSGGGEIAQYCHNNFIYHYNNSYPIDKINKNLNLLQNDNYLHYNWNLHGCTNAILIRDNIDKIFEHMILNLK